MKRWYVLQTKLNRENDVAQFLSMAHFEAFLPKIRDILYRGNLSHFRLKPLFPSYLFLHVDFETGKNFHLIKYTRGISKILCSEGKPLPIQDAVIQALKIRINLQGIVENQVQFNPGQPIRIKKGLLRDLVGIIEKPTSSEERMIVLVKLLNYEMKANLHWTEIERIAA